MRIVHILLLTFICQLFINDCFAASPAPLPKSSDEVAFARLKLDTEQAASNRQLELQKLEMEKTKAWITGGSLMVPLMVAAFTLALGVWNQNQQARPQRETQDKAERAQFELKAAELVLNEKGPVGAKNKARALQALFPDKLPLDFVSSFNPDDFEGPKTESYEAKKAFFERVAAGQTDVNALASLWKKLFPGDNWAEQLQDNSSPTDPPPPTQS